MKNKIEVEVVSELRIRNVPTSVVEDLQTISKNLGTNVAALLKPKLRKIVDEYPSELKIKRSID